MSYLNQCHGCLLFGGISYAMIGPGRHILLEKAAHGAIDSSIAEIVPDVGRSRNK